eukprot:1396756-Rhodomonas_salina.3
MLNGVLLHAPSSSSFESVSSSLAKSSRRLASHHFPQAGLNLLLGAARRLVRGVVAGAVSGSHRDGAVRLEATRSERGVTVTGARAHCDSLPAPLSDWHKLTQLALAGFRVRATVTGPSDLEAQAQPRLPRPPSRSR